MLEDILSGIGGAAAGYGKGRMWDQEYKQQDRAIDSRKEVAALRAEVQALVARIAADSREKVASIGADSRVDVAGIGAGSRRDVANINQGGANRRADMQNTFLYDKLFTEDETDRHLHDNASGSAQLGADTTRRGQDLSSQTARRGQDISSGDRRYATDTGAATARAGQGVTRRGQDLNYQIGKDRVNVARTRAQNTFDDVFSDAPPDPLIGSDVELPAEPAAARGGLPVTPRGNGQPTYRWPDGTTRAYPPPPPEVPGAGAPLPVAPRTAPSAAAPVAPATDPAAGRGDPLTELTLQATALLTQMRAERDPRKKEALRAELARLKAEKDRLVTGGR